MTKPPSPAPCHWIASRTSRKSRARFLLTADALWISDDLRLPAGDQTARIRFRILCQRTGGGSKSMDFQAVELPRVAATGALPAILQPSGLAWRGLAGAALTPASPRRTNPRPRPAVPFASAGRANRPATVTRQRVPVEVVEETGRERHNAPLHWGLPLPAGALSDPRQVRLVEGDRELPADVAATSCWPDGSLRWVLVSTAVDLPAGGRRTLTVEFGSEVRRAAAAGVKVDPEPGRVVVDTGAGRWTVATDPLRLDGPGLTGGAFTLRDEQGAAHALRAAQATVEYAGERLAIVRLEAPYQATGKAFLRAIVRLTFRAGSPAVEVAHTLVDDDLTWEFANFRELVFRASLPPGPSRTAFAVGTEGGVPTEREAAELAVPSDASFALDGRAQDGRTLGALVVETAGGGAAVGVTDLWQRYPKALAVREGQLCVDLLPAQQGAAKPPADLPAHVAFPFVEGCYRFKWGMSTTDRFLLAPFAAGGRAAALAAALDQTQPLVAVLPATWYAQTGALGELAAPDGQLFAAWDEAFAEAFAGHLRLKDARREYGFFNWGDWHGERETNWGNNEYDLPHGLFLQFARTGRRDYYRLALAGARHQADVDMIHAYPDPMFVGGNLLHSYAHTGEWSQHIAERSWSFAYGYHGAAWNGHTWAHGLCDAWYLAGEPRVMEAALSLGEHIAWQMAPEFKELGTHERSAGWSAHAIAALYQATADPAYREALDRINAIAYQEQKFDDGGAWPHPLPSDHAGGVPGARGNVAFLIGVLLSGIDDHDALTGHPAARRSMVAAAEWLKTQWAPHADAFQYTSSPAFKASVSRGQAGLNNLILSPLLKVHAWTGDPQCLEIATRGFVASAVTDFSPFGKSFAQVAHFAPPIMARLKAAGAVRQPYGRILTMTGADFRREAILAAPPPAALRLRGPLEKTVIFRHEGGAVTFAARREAWGARVKDEAEGWVRLVGPDGAVVKEQRFSTDTFPVTFEASLPATAPRGDWRLVVHDDLRGRWDVTGPTRRVVAVGDGVQFGGLGEARWSFQVPRGTRTFKVGLTAHHAGAFGCWVLDPNGRPLVTAEGRQGAPGADRLEREVAVPAGADGQPWSLVVFAGMDLSIRLEGVPGYLATSPEAWFEPAATPRP